MINTYDFKIDLSVWRQTRDAYSKVEKCLDAERERLEEAVDSVTCDWDGDASDATREWMRYFLEEGNLWKSIELIKSMRQFLEETEPQISKLSVRCGHFAQQLMSDTYEEPFEGSGCCMSGANGGVISLNYNMAEIVLNLCSEVQKEGEDLVRDMERTMNSCSDLVDVGPALAKLRSGQRKLNRICNYRESLAEYKRGVEMLEADMTVRLSGIANRFREEAATETLPDSNSEIVDSSEGLRLTENVKEGYHRIIDYLPDGVILICSATNPLVNIGSNVQALVNQNLENAHEYIVINGRSEGYGLGDSIWDATLGMLEQLVTTQVLEPGEYLKDALTGEGEDEGLWGKIKFTAAFVQMVTGNPAYTATEALEESVQSITESCKTCGKILNALMSITPEEWAVIRQQVEEGIAGAVEQGVAETVSLQQELASLTPKEWKELAVQVCKYTYEWQENLVQDFFSEENMKDVYYGVGYGEGTLIMLYLESVIGAELAGKLGMLDDAAKADDILKSDGIDEEQISDVIDDMLPDGSDVADMKKVEAVVEGGGDTIITPEMEEKILLGQRKNPAKNELIGGHSPDINNSNPNYAVEVLQVNPDGTQKVKFVTQYADGNLSNIKTSTLFPEGWSSDKIINSIKTVGDSTPIGVRASDGAMLYRDIIDGVQIEVIKIGDTVTSGYPTGGIKTGLLPGFSTLE